MKLKPISSLKLIKFLSTKGFLVHHKKGSHFVLFKKNFGRVVVPERKNLAIGTLRAILRETGISREEFVFWLNKNS